jgi:hypothetical protein
MQFYSSVFISASQEAGTGRHKMKQSLSRFVTPVELGKRMKKKLFHLNLEGALIRSSRTLRPSRISFQGAFYRIPAKAV